ncbi:hypothetical protein ZIOFF_020980 [Zingiber officinale]|uniref:dUTP diphosphatase n=1 Tax=Zingiber officinale TaxID=94328 RepID=A0A8J5H186_ZINOF|nr:hypothetical protein ZIOFF_020980 [Zingiber officinale]
MATSSRNPPVTTITRTEGAPLFEDQVREYRQNQRRRYNAQRAIQRVARRVVGGNHNNTLEQQLDPQTQLRLSMQERAAIVPAEVLYHSRRDDVHHRVYVHRSEEALLVTSNQVDRAFIQPESFNQLQRSGMRFLHMGVIQVRIQILHRQEEGTLALIVFRDNRWQGDQAIFATMEVDLTRGSQLVYVIPDTMLTISDFYRNIQVSILARGYENWRNGEANLLITRGLVGRLSNTPNVGFAYEVQNVVDYLASHGVRALPGRSYNTRDVLGQNWIIRQSTVNIPMQPTEVNTRNMLDGSVSLQFDQYQAASSSDPLKYNAKDEEIQSDEEEVARHSIAVFVEEEIPEELLVKRIHSLAQIPTRRTAGAAGYDISITHAQDIPALGRSLLSTGLCIQIPHNTYGRIAPRSSSAMRGIIIMGGVIDSDYRGEVKVMAFNTTNEDIFLNKQECIAQIILERITTPEVKEVEQLGLTERGASGFGSTTQQQVCTSSKANPECLGCYYCCSDEEDAATYDACVAPDYSTHKGKQKEVISPLAIKTVPEEELLAVQAAARQYAIEQHKMREEEAYLDLLAEDDSFERSFAISRRQLRDSREYRRQLQAELNALKAPKATSSTRASSSSTQFLCVFSNEETTNNRWEPLGEPDTNPRWDTLGEPSGKPMDSYKRRRIGSSTMGGYYYSTPGQAQQSGNSTSEEPYHFLAQYKEVTNSRGPGVCTVLEEDARKHLADIEKTVANQLIHNLLELKLIQDIKEADFSIRSEHPKGLYFKDSLPRVTAVKSSLFGAFLQLQGVLEISGVHGSGIYPVVVSTWPFREAVRAAWRSVNDYGSSFSRWWSISGYSPGEGSRARARCDCNLAVKSLRLFRSILICLMTDKQLKEVG